MISKLERESKLQRSGRIQIPGNREMIAITADTGQFFWILIRAIRATRVLEIGTSSGFSTLWFADAITSVAKQSGSTKLRPFITTIEANPEKVGWATRHFKQARVDGIITILPGLAIEALRQVRRSGQMFDFVFIDADKENMTNYFDLVLPMVRINGIIAADNMLYPEKFKAEMQKYARHVRSKRNVRSVTLPIGMGEEITIRTF